MVSGMRTGIGIVALALLLGSCGNDKRYTGQELMASLKEVNSINGPVIYSYDLETGMQNSVFKYEYVNLPAYRVAINRDTLKLGEPFVGEVIVDAKPAVTLIIESPEPARYESAEKGMTKIVRWNANSVGEYQFRGVILYDTVRIPFVYKFLVTNQE